MKNKIKFFENSGLTLPFLVKCSLLFVPIFISAQNNFYISIIDDHVNSYESSTYKICFDGNGELRTFNYLPEFSSLERKDLQGVLEDFYLSPKFENRLELANLCIISTTFQVNSKFENAVIEEKECKQFQQGTFIYGKSHFEGIIVRRNKKNQKEIGQNAIITSNIEWENPCSYNLFSPQFEDSIEELDHSIKIQNKILNVQENNILIETRNQDSRHFLDLIKVNSLDLVSKESAANFTLEDEIQELKITDAILELKDGNIKYFNFVMNANSPKIRLKNFPKSTVSFTDSFCSFKLNSAEIKSETIVLNGILSLPNDYVEIELNGKFNKIKNKYHLIFDDVEIPLESENKQAVLSAEFVFKK